MTRLTQRVKRLEWHMQSTDEVHGQGIASLLAYARRHDIAVDHVPIMSLTDAELDARIATLAGQRGLSLCLREYLEEERMRRQEALAKEPPA